MRSDFTLKTNITPEKDNKHDIHPEDTSSRHLWLINYDEETSTIPLALVGYPLLGPFRLVRAY